jgi:hypothetical protein
MKAPTMPAAESAGFGLLLKVGTSLGAGLLGAAIIASFDPPATRRELFKQAAVAGVGSMVFGPVAVRIVGHYIPYLASVTGLDALEVTVPIYFLVGALSWGFMGAVAKFREVLAKRGAEALARRIGLEKEHCDGA